MPRTQAMPLATARVQRWCARGERDVLLGYIHKSRCVQRSLCWLLLFGLCATLMAMGTGYGVAAFLTVLFVGGVGFYITGMHIAEWRARVHELDMQAAAQLDGRSDDS